MSSGNIATGIKILIIGGDGLIGKALYNSIASSGGNVSKTSRSYIGQSQSNLYLDLQSEASVTQFDVSGYNLAFFCAGLSKYAECENHALSHQVNVDNATRMCFRLMSAGCSVVYLSTSAVFDGEVDSPNENSKTCATTSYGRQKCELEKALIPFFKNPDEAGLAKVVRITKVLSPNLPILQEWRDTLQMGKHIYPLSDLNVCPVSLRYSVDALLAIGLSLKSGIFHLSGGQVISYAELARKLAKRWGQPIDRVRPISSSAAAIHLPNTPKWPSLGMDRTSQLTGLLPQPLEKCIADVSEVTK